MVANKDLLATDGGPTEIEKAKMKLRELCKGWQRLDIIISAAEFNQNLTKVVALMQAHVQGTAGRCGISWIMFYKLTYVARPLCLPCRFRILLSLFKATF